ncbi:MAG: amidohydrolase family protein [candidate division WS1 bacterium]|jgi:imidazolonepropionase-like amidohydrolase|nr:amidohydrolase family protein [candidate division WS1 bacterium]
MTGPKAIVNGRVIDGTGAAPIDDGVVLIRDGRVEAIVTPDEVDLPADVEVIDASGRTVMPGLVEGHAHVGGTTAAQQVLRLSLQRGITTVCSVSANAAGIALRDGIEARQVRGCARLIAGCVVSPTFGHVRYRTADGPWEVRKAVREMVQLGADFIKTAASGGFWGADEVCSVRNYTPEELDALVDEAHAWFRPVVVHAHTQPGLNNAIAAGVDQIHHGAFIDEEAVRGILDADLWYMPTLRVTSDRNIGAWPERPWMEAEMRPAQPVHREGVRLAHELGVKIAVGSDYPSSKHEWEIGDACIWELMELVQAGLTPMEAIVASVKTTPEAYRLEDIGPLVPGNRADLIIVDGDPLADIGVLYDQRNIKLTIKDGAVESADIDYAWHYRIREDQPTDRPQYDPLEGAED